VNNSVISDKMLAQLLFLIIGTAFVPDYWHSCCSWLLAQLLFLIIGTAVVPDYRHSCCSWLLAQLLFLIIQC